MTFDVRQWERKLQRIILVGGQCAGKSKTLHAIRKRWKDELRYIPELAGFIRRQFKLKPSNHAPDTQANVQQGIYVCQLWVEYAAEQAALEGGCLATICDRGTLDGAVYHPGGFDRWCKDCGTSLELEHARYDHVIYLEQAMEEVYVRRTELYSERRPSLYPIAQERARNLRELWMGHPNFHYIPNYPTAQEKYQAVLSLLEELLMRKAATDQPRVAVNSGFILKEQDGPASSSETG